MSDTDNDRGCSWDGSEAAEDSCTCGTASDTTDKEMAAEYDRAREYDKPPSERTWQSDVVGEWEASALAVRVTEICWCDDECGTRPCVTYDSLGDWAEPAIVYGPLASRAAMRAARSLMREEGGR